MIKKSKCTFEKATFLMIVALSLFLVSSCENNTEGKVTSTSSSKAEHKLPKLLDLGSGTCIPCKMMAPILDELTVKYEGIFDVEFIDLRFQKNSPFIDLYRIRAIPTQIFLDADGKELWRHEGFLAKNDILNKWKELGYSFNI